MELLGSRGMPRAGRLAAVATAAAATLVAGLGVAALANDGDFATSEIASYALAHFAPGAFGGQCIVFAERVVDAVYRAGGVAHGFPPAGGPQGYYTAFARSGGQLVGEAGPGGYAAALALAQRGDIVQLSPRPAASAGPWTDPGGGHQHTAILLGPASGGAEVIDSNWDLHLRVLIHPLADVVADAVRWRLEIAVWGYGIPGP